MTSKNLTPKQTSDQNNEECHMAPTPLDAVIFLKSVFCIINSIQWSSQCGKIFTEIIMEYTFHSVLTQDVLVRIAGVDLLDYANAVWQKMDAEADINYGGGKKMQQLKCLKINSIIISYVIIIHTTQEIEIPLQQKRETKFKKIEH